MITFNFCQYCQWFSAVVYYFEMIEYIAQSNLNIRIQRDITGPPKDASGKPARRAVWWVKCGLGRDRFTNKFPFDKREMYEKFRKIEKSVCKILIDYVFRDILFKALLHLFLKIASRSYFIILMFVKE